VYWSVSWIQGRFLRIGRDGIGMDLVQATTGNRKRKAENQDNERLSKRLSLLNLGSYCTALFCMYICSNDLAERTGEKLYVPVEQPAAVNSPPSKPLPTAQDQDVDLMQVDDSKFRVWVHNLDDELSDSESDDGKLVFLPNIEKHLRESRIPASILANSEGELAGNKQMVLYSVPSSLSVPEEQDSVRKAILEARARVRAKQDARRGADAQRPQVTNIIGSRGVDMKDWFNSTGEATLADVAAKPSDGMLLQGIGTQTTSDDDDPDAMDLG